MKLLTIIPVRKNSKRIQNKSKAIVGGVTLFHRTLNSIKKINFIKDIIISSDDPHIKKISKQFENINFFQRKSTLSQDNSKTVDVIIDLINNPKIIKYNFDTILILQITSPFRSPSFIKKAINTFKTNNLKSLVSVKNLSTSKLFLETNNKFFFKKFLNKPFKNIFIPDGQIYLCNINHLRKHKNLYSKHSYCLKSINEYESIDIDTVDDLQYANFISNKFKI